MISQIPGQRNREVGREARLPRFRSMIFHSVFLLLPVEPRRTFPVPEPAAAIHSLSVMTTGIQAKRGRA